MVAEYYTHEVTQGSPHLNIMFWIILYDKLDNTLKILTSKGNDNLLIALSPLYFITFLNATHFIEKLIVILKIFIDIWLSLRFEMKCLIFVKVVLFTDELHFHKLMDVARFLIIFSEAQS